MTILGPESRWRRPALRFLGAIATATLVSVVSRALGTNLPRLLVHSFSALTNAPPNEQPLLWHLLDTMRRFAVGYSIAVAVAIPLGVLTGRSRVARELLDVPIETLRPIPSAVIIPLGIVFLGIYEPMKVFVIAFGALWPMLVVTREACRNIDSTLLDTARVFGIGKIRTFLDIVIPAALPHIAAGARASLSIALLLAVTVEMLVGGAPRGLGFFIRDAEESFRRTSMLSGILVLGIVGYLLNLVFAATEKLVLSRRFAYLKDRESC